jgi:hypothetical protein
MIIRRLGSVLSFRISPRVIVAATIFLLAYVAISIIIINKYADLRFTNAELDRVLERKQREVEQRLGSLRDARQRILVLKKEIDRFEKQRDRQERPDKEEESPPVSAAGGSVESQEETQLEVVSEGLVDIRDLVFARDDSKAAVRFRLVNIEKGNEPVGGYVHLIACDSTEKPRRIWAFPPQVLRDGVPLNYRKGRRFRIRRFVPIKGEFEFSPEDVAPVALRVMVYDRAGQVIFDKKYDVGSSWKQGRWRGNFESRRFT